MDFVKQNLPQIVIGTAFGAVVAYTLYSISNREPIFEDEEHMKIRRSASSATKKIAANEILKRAVDEFTQDHFVIVNGRIKYTSMSDVIPWVFKYMNAARYDERI